MVLQVAAREGVERGKRLIQEQHFGLRHQRTRDRHPLRLAAGEFARPRSGLVGKPDPRQCGGHLLAANGTGHIRQAEADIVGDTEPGQQPRLLEDDADFGVRRRYRRLVERHRA